MAGTEYLLKLKEASDLCLIIGGCFLVLTVVLCVVLRIPEILRNITGRARKIEIRRHRMGITGSGTIPGIIGSSLGQKQERYWNTTSGMKAQPMAYEEETTVLQEDSGGETSVLPSGKGEETDVLENGERSIVLVHSDNSLI